MFVATLCSVTRQMARLAALSTVLADTLAILLLGTAAIVVKFGGIRPYQRGFYCYDTSIRHPYKVPPDSDIQF